MYTTIFHGMMSTTFLLLLQPFLTTALHIGTSSPCKEACAGGALTETKHLSCIDSAYGSGGTAAGQQMKTCLECTQKSNYSNASDTETDQYWMMFHLKYTQQFCLFESGSNQITDCGTECAPLRGPMTDLWGDTTPPQYLWEYCDHSSGSYPVYAPDCAACLRARSGTVILGNFVETMSDACGVQPNVSTTGDLIQIKATNGNLFDSQTESISTTSAPTATDTTATIPADATATDADAAAQEGSSNQTTASSSTATPDSDSGLSSGATIGIGVGVGVAAVAAIAAAIFFIVRRRRARRVAAPSSVDEKSGFVGGNSLYGGSAHGSYRNEQKFHGYGQEMMGSGRHPVEMSGQGMVSEMDGGRGHVAELSAGCERR